ncbi:MAG: dTDP-4-dehydrorhamnose 3,5-epimerase [Jaaginema sp. PMC 1079.18]|nr:dTDP-4-dehydrorhamnose 3,5-epimerase [Jaaginema sp. PMC 1080.18]MEC4850196.1 dTDP-4-dehydrorhamnose 3,5-epimerase [Jaaginema sp. PMC 1079.18]MEC4865291.1 dTDP-4-dehydrorhamnose 3,5-epimerase [Jaaginema sp. PMC 1078.18]
MRLIASIETYQLESIHSGMAQFYTPQASNETMLVQIAANTIDELFVHRYQTDQLLVVRGSFVLVILQNRHYEYIYLSEDDPKVVKIPPGVPHGAINLNSSPCVMVNAVLRHGKTHERDYRPIPRPFPYDITQAQALVNANHYSETAIL